MASPAQDSTSESPADLTQAFRDLSRGEQAATALEANLTNLESKLDAILTALEAKEAAEAAEKAKTSTD